MADSIQFLLAAEHMARYLSWRAAVEAETGTPVEAVLFSFLVSHRGQLQILVRPATDADYKLHGVERLDGTYDTFAPHETVLAEYDNFGFASTRMDWHDMGIRLHLCAKEMLERGDIPRCYVECLYDPHQPLLPFRVSAQPVLLQEDILLRVFPSTHLPPAVSQRVQDFIRTNVAVLLQHWHGEIDSFRLLDALRSPEDAATEEGEERTDG